VSAPVATELRAADLLARRLYAAGCRFAFGMPGGEVLTLLDALRRAGIRFVLCRHENAAAFMAEGVWHRSGAPAVLLATIGPGVLNAVNAVFNANQDRVPLIVISGCVDPAEQETYTHQVLDHQAVLRPACKASFMLTADAAGVVADKAVALALQDRPGPVHIDVPISVAAAPAPAYEYRRVAAASTVPAEGPALAQARQWLAEAERPLIIAGNDAVLHGAGPAVVRLVEDLGIPLFTTYKAKGLLPEDHSLAMGSIALSPVADRIAKPMIDAADMILLAGYDPIEMRIGWRNPWDPARKCVVEVSAAANDHYMHHASLSFVADVGASLDRIGAGLQRRNSAWPDGEPARVRAALKAAFKRDAAWGPAAIVDELRRCLPRDALVTVDAGAHRIVASQVLEMYEPNAMYQSMGLCTMGCAVPLAAGAKLASPERTVVALVGDGGLLMVLGELSSLSDYGIAVVIVVFVDRSLALIEMKQRAMKLDNVGVDFTGDYDYVEIAKAMGGDGCVVKDRQALAAAVRAATARRTFSLVACDFDRAAYDGLI